MEDTNFGGIFPDKMQINHHEETSTDYFRGQIMIVLSKQSIGMIGAPT